MSKSKSKGSKGVSKPNVDVLTKVKDASVVKPSQAPKAKSKELAKQVASKNQQKPQTKRVKEPTPESSDSESEQSEESEESASSESSDDEDSSEVEAKKPALNGKANGHVKEKNKVNVKNIESTDDEDGSDSSGSFNDQAPANGVLGKAPVMTEAGSDSDESDDSEESEAEIPAAKRTAESSDESDSEEESDGEGTSPKHKGPVKAAESSKKLTPIASEQDSDRNDTGDDDEDEDSDGSTDSDEDSDEDSEKSEAELKSKPVASTKRKAVEQAIPVAKKTRTADVDADAQGGNLFVGNLSWNVDEEWLTREFEEFGELSGVRLITDRTTGRSKGYVNDQHSTRRS